MTDDTFTWKHEYEIGIEAIDLQHHYFVNLVGEFTRHLPDADHLLQQRLFAELNAYAKFHFISEENLMFRHKYPGLQAHELQHRTLIDQLSAKQGLFGLKKLGAGEVIGFLQGWFIGHTTHEDRLFADFLRQQR